MRCYRSTFLEKIEDRPFFAKKRRQCRLYLRKRTPLHYDNVIRTSILNIFSQMNPIDVTGLYRLTSNTIKNLTPQFFGSFFVSKEAKNNVCLKNCDNYGV